MTQIIPIGCVTIDEAAEMIAKSLSMVTKEREIVAELRQSGLDVGDGAAVDSAIAEIWRAADPGKLRVVGIGGNPTLVETLAAAPPLPPEREALIREALRLKWVTVKRDLFEVLRNPA
jgi:hypothetical protein